MTRFTFTNENDFDNTHVNYSFDAESIHDVFDHMKYFLRACGYEAAGDIGLFPDVIESYDESEYQKDHAFDNIPNNSWPFGESKPSTESQSIDHKQGWYEWVQQEAQVKSGIPALTTMDLSVLTSRQIESWSLPTDSIKALTSADIAAWSMPMPGTAGSAQYKWPDKDAY